MNINDIEQLYHQIELNNIDPNSELYWTYSFFAGKRGDLWAAVEELRRYEFVVSEIWEDKEVSNIYWMKASKKESLTAFAMLDKCQQLEELAADFRCHFDCFELEY